MALFIDIIKIGSEVLSALLRAERAQRFEVSEHFSNLSRTFKAYPQAHRSSDKDQIQFHVGKTHGLVESLRSTGIFDSVLGRERTDEFFEAIRMVLAQKILMMQGQHPDVEAAYGEIMAVAGYFDGFAESLRAQAGKQ